MKHFLKTFWIAFFAFSSSYAQENFKKFSLKISFAPSFMYGCNINVAVAADKGFIILTSRQYKKNITDSAILQKHEILKLRKFLTDSLKYVDTIRYIKAADGSDTKTPDMRMGLDGITVGGGVYVNDRDRRFQFWSPEKNSANARFVALILSVANAELKGNETANYLEQLEQYFPHQLGLKRISGDPIKYKLYGAITSSEENQLRKFFNSLPTNKRVEIDVSNYSGMGTMFYPIIGDYIHSHRQIFWIKPTYKCLIDLYKIGVANDHIVSEKKIKKIETINGEEVITTVEY